MTKAKVGGPDDKDFKLVLADSAAIIYGAKVVNATLSHDGKDVKVRFRGLKRSMGSPYLTLWRQNTAPDGRSFMQWYEPDHMQTMSELFLWFKGNLPARKFLSGCPGITAMRLEDQFIEMLTHRARTAMDRLAREAAAAVKAVDTAGAADTKKTASQRKEALKLAKKNITIYLEADGDARVIQNYLDCEITRVVLKS